MIPEVSEEELKSEDIKINMRSSHEPFIDEELDLSEGENLDLGKLLHNDHYGSLEMLKRSINNQRVVSDQDSLKRSEIEM